MSRTASHQEDTMKLTIIAATGGVGRQLLAQALDAGHDVTAVARTPAKLPQDLRAAARIVTADLASPDPHALESAVVGADAVLSALGPHNNADAGIAAPGTAAIISAMRTAGVRRIVAISASPVATTPSPGRPRAPRRDPGDGFVMRYLGNRIAKTLFGKVYDDLARMEDVLRDSGLDWTALRPPQLTGKPLTGRYRTAVGQNVRGGWSIPRADVAHYMLAALDQPDTIGQVIGIAT
jgi:putative NADH-flavin reductase